MKTLIKIVRRSVALVAVGVCLALGDFEAEVSAQTSLTFNLPSVGTNGSVGANTNLPAASITVFTNRPVPSGIARLGPAPVSIFVSGAGITAGVGTNTFVWAPSYDGVTLATNNGTFTSTLVLNNGTNIGTSYYYSPETNFYGAIGVGLASFSLGGTNGFSNGVVRIMCPY